MSEKQMKRFNIVSIKEVAEGLLIHTIDGDDWIYGKDNVLLHRCNRNRKGSIQFHPHGKVDGYLSAMLHVRSHAHRMTKPKKLNGKAKRMEYLFSLI